MGVFSAHPPASLATERVVPAALAGNDRMSAHQIAPGLDLSATYHLKAAGCEQQAEHATDQATEQEWRQLAVQWRSMADQAAAMSADLRGSIFLIVRLFQIYFENCPILGSDSAG